MEYKITYEQKYWGDVIVNAKDEIEAREKAREEIESGDNANIIDCEIILLESNGKEIL